jgi:predicted HicB family RNase H-like nuclease
MQTKEALNIRKKFTTTIDEEVIKRLKLQAIREQTDANKIIERLILEYLEKKREEKTT